MNVIAEYIWLDGYEPARLRAKTKIIECDMDTTEKLYSFKQSEWLKFLPEWSFDGSSTKQADGHDSDCVLKPTFITQDPFREGLNVLVICEVLNVDGTPHNTNTRNKLVETMDSLENDYQPWFGWEQEYTMMRKIINHSDGTGLPLGFTFNTINPEPRPQGEYYCGVGSENVIGREIADEHMKKCMMAGLKISGVNAEVMVGQWEYQIGPVDAINGSDQLIMSRYILDRVAETAGVVISLHPKPVQGDWNGSGCHVNFSTRQMREWDTGYDLIKEACDKLGKKHDEHISVYGLHNEQRLTGKHETASIHEFSYGEGDRGASIRIPVQTKLNGKGYFEDRRPSSNCDPYLVAEKILDTVCN